MNRYVRQMVLPEIGVSGQQALQGKRVLVVGAGGLGSSVIPALAGAGVGHLLLVDPDHVEESNLHRQLLYRMADLGRPKAVCAAEAVLALTPEVSVASSICRLDPGNAAAFLKGIDLVVDAADSFAATYTLSDRCQVLGLPLISASVLARQGYVGGFCGGAPSYRAVFPDLPNRGQTCAESGVMGPVVAALGALQAQMALACLLGLEPSPLGQVMQLDLAAWRLSGFRFDGAEDLPGPVFIAADQLTETDRVIELRDASEAPQPAHPAALRVAPDQLATLPAVAGRTVLVCTSGLRAWRAADQLAARGQGNLALLATG